MPSFQEHCAETVVALGEPFEQVHLWLDEFAGKPPHGMRHRKLRHHRAGVEEVRKLWGDQAAEAARLHIIADLKQEGWTAVMPFPRDESHYKNMGLF
ncbi:MAG TPA: hypothetical protein VFC44_23360 [Candidatus Saccharimonadales bacterium]|nr:hypothetical protein [Candidatus Saccharimonadales bacterium]